MTAGTEATLALLGLPEYADLESLIINAQSEDEVKAALEKAKLVLYAQWKSDAAPDDPSDEPADEGTTPPDPGTKPSDDSKTSPSKALPKTGDPTAPYAILTVVAAAAGATALIAGVFDHRWHRS